MEGPKFELTIYDSDGKGTDLVVRGELEYYGFDNDIEPIFDSGVFRKYVVLGKYIKLRGRERAWVWHKGKPTWTDAIDKEKADPLRVQRVVRPKGG